MRESSDEPLSRPLTYSSEAILDRRHRILTETWKLIAEKGMQGFSVRELSQRAGVSQGTFYNAFGTRENAIAMAVTEYALSAVGGGPYNYRPSTLDGRIERLMRLHARVRSNRHYIAATMNVFWSDTIANDAKQAMAAISHEAHLPYLKSLQQRRALVPYITADRLLETLTVSHYGVLSYWVAGGFPDADLPRRVVEEFLLVLAGATRGAAAREIEQWRKDVLEGSERWTAIVDQAEAAATDIMA